ncbi:MAG: hypothetical protein ACE5MB_11305 [Anaerolineae bacterium]
MSTKIELQIYRHPDPDEPSLIVTRLLTYVALLTEEGGLTESRLAIVDTGAPTSIIPYDLWVRCPVLKIRDKTIRGIVPKPECALRLIEGLIACVIHDGIKSIGPLIIRADLAPTANVPLILGFSGLLDKADVRFSIVRGEAYWEI